VIPPRGTAALYRPWVSRSQQVQPHHGLDAAPGPTRPVPGRRKRRRGPPETTSGPTRSTPC